MDFIVRILTTFVWIVAFLIAQWAIMKVVRRGSAYFYRRRRDRMFR